MYAFVVENKNKTHMIFNIRCTKDLISINGAKFHSIISLNMKKVFKSSITVLRKKRKMVRNIFNTVIYSRDSG